MANDWQTDPPETDGWVDDEVDPYAPTRAGLPAVEGDGPPSPQPQPPQQLPMKRPLGHGLTLSEDEIEEGKALALVSHGSILLGIPLFIIPMLQRENEFALHHAKAAAVNFGFLIFAIAVTTVTCGLFFPLIFLVYVPAIVAAVQAANGELAGTWGWGPAGEKLFPKLHAKSEPKQLEGDD